MPFRMAKNKCLVTAHAGKNAQKPDHSNTDGGMWKGEAPLAGCWEFLIKLNMFFPYEPAVLPLDM